MVVHDAIIAWKMNISLIFVELGSNDVHFRSKHYPNSYAALDIDYHGLTLRFCHSTLYQLTGFYNYDQIVILPQGVLRLSSG